MTYFNLAVALENLGRWQDAEAVLEKGTAAYPFNGPLTARLAELYAIDGQNWRAYALVRKYRLIFPEEHAVREALEQIGHPSIIPSYAENRTVPGTQPK